MHAFFFFSPVSTLELERGRVGRLPTPRLPPPRTHLGPALSCHRDAELCCRRTPRHHALLARLARGRRWALGRRHRHRSRCAVHSRTGAGRMRTAERVGDGGASQLLQCRVLVCTHRHVVNAHERHLLPRQTRDLTDPVPLEHHPWRLHARRVRHSCCLFTTKHNNKRLDEFLKKQF